MTREEVERRLETSPVDAEWNKNTVLHVMDALRHFARAPDGKVPSEAEIIEAMKDRRDGAHDLFTTCARVAHAIMLRIGGQGEMMLDGLTPSDLNRALRDVTVNTLISVHALDKIVNEVIRLATTPRITDDPDKQAKRWAHRHTILNVDGGTAVGLDWFWETLTDTERDFWRAVAKGKVDE